MNKKKILEIYRKDKQLYSKIIKDLYKVINNKNILNVTLNDYLLFTPIPTLLMTYNNDIYYNFNNYYFYHSDNIYRILNGNICIPSYRYNTVPFMYNINDKRVISNVYYYEIFISTHRFRESFAGETLSFGYGLFNSNNSNIHVGWLMDSVGYHSDDGCIFKNGYKYNKNITFGLGDIVGAGIEYIEKDTFKIFFTKNGKLIYKDIMFLTNKNIYPQVSLYYSAGIFINFGEVNFAYDFTNHNNPNIICTKNTFINNYRFKYRKL